MREFLLSLQFADLFAEGINLCLEFLDRLKRDGNEVSVGYCLDSVFLTYEFWELFLNFLRDNTDLFFVVKIDTFVTISSNARDLI